MNNADAAVGVHDAKHFAEEAAAELKEEERFERVGERSLELLTDPVEVETLLENLMESEVFLVVFSVFMKQYIKGFGWIPAAQDLGNLAIGQADIIAEREVK